MDRRMAKVHMAETVRDTGEADKAVIIPRAVNAIDIGLIVLPSVRAKHCHATCKSESRADELVTRN
jgi:hypothetical protein